MVFYQNVNQTIKDHEVYNTHKKVFCYDTIILQYEVDDLKHQTSYGSEQYTTISATIAADWLG